MRPTLVLVGGFLGAGKTTLLLAAASRLRAAGRRVGIITNDQGGELVDTRFLRAAGFPTEEIGGGCFCCRFSEFLRSAERLLAAQPDVILAEAVGSCTDLSATVLQPIKKFCGERFRLAPFTVLVDATRPRLEDPCLAYLLEKQVAEADIVRHTKTGDDFDVAAWLEEVLAPEPRAGTRLLDIDYQRYAEAEARLGWLNWQAEVWLRRPLTPAAVLGPLLESLDLALTRAGVAIAHLKMFAQAATGYIKASICRNGEEPSIDGQLDAPPATRHSLALNLRATGAPELLREIVNDAAAGLPGRLEVRHFQAFRPAPPRPEQRFTELA